MFSFVSSDFVKCPLFQKKLKLSSVSEEGRGVIEYAMRGVREDKEGVADVFRYLLVGEAT